MNTPTLEQHTSQKGPLLKRPTKIRNLPSREAAGSGKLGALKRRMDNAVAEFHRIPDECELDAVECERRRQRMVDAKLRYVFVMTCCLNGKVSDSRE